MKSCESLRDVRRAQLERRRVALGSKVQRNKKRDGKDADSSIAINIPKQLQKREGHGWLLTSKQGTSNSDRHDLDSLLSAIRFLGCTIYK
jgi:hypothetical protein